MNDDFIPPATPEELRRRRMIFLDQSTALFGLDLSRDELRERIKLPHAKFDELTAYGLAMWPDEFDERVFARVVDKRDSRHDKIGQVGRVDHSCVELRFPDGHIGSYHSMALEQVKLSDYNRQLGK
jgi:hypothetical protein